MLTSLTLRKQQSASVGRRGLSGIPGQDLELEEIPLLAWKWKTSVTVLDLQGWPGGCSSRGSSLFDRWGQAVACGGEMRCCTKALECLDRSKHLTSKLNIFISNLNHYISLKQLKHFLKLNPILAPLFSISEEQLNNMKKRNRKAVSFFTWSFHLRDDTRRK